MHLCVYHLLDETWIAGFAFAGLLRCNQRRYHRPWRLGVNYKMTFPPVRQSSLVRAAVGRIPVCSRLFILCMLLAVSKRMLKDSYCNLATHFLWSIAHLQEMNRKRRAIELQKPAEDDQSICVGTFLGAVPRQRGPLRGILVRQKDCVHAAGFVFLCFPCCPLCCFSLVRYIFVD